MISPTVSPIIKLGLLDSAGLGLQEVFEVAQQADALGYERFWIAEHFESGAHASALMMSSLVAGITERIRVGPAGVLLAFGAPLEVANAALLLSTVFPGRIDLGVAAGASSPEVLQELTGGSLAFAAPGYLEDKVRRLVHLVRGEAPVRARPIGAPAPPVWVLGSSGNRATLAAELGVAYSISLFHAPGKAQPEHLQSYRDQFRASVNLPAPLCNIGVTMICADTEQDARRLSRQNSTFNAARIVGTPGQCWEQIAEHCHRFDVDEAVVLDACPNFEARSRSIALLAEAARLTPQVCASAPPIDASVAMGS